MKFTKIIRAFFFLLVVSYGWAEGNRDDSTLVPSPEKPAVTQHDLDIEMMKLELQKCQLDNEKLQLEIDRLRMQKGFGPETAPTSVPQPPPKDSDNKNGLINFEASTRAEQLSKENSPDPKTIIFDTENAEVWIEGIRYPAFELNRAMQDKNWDYKKSVATTKADGTRRFRYSYQNLTLEKYETEKFGVITIVRPYGDKDFRILTVEGVGFNVPESEVRNRFQNEYFRYENEERNDKTYDLRYKHTHGLFGWDDLLVFIFEAKTHALMEIKYGVLDEN